MSDIGRVAADWLIKAAEVADHSAPDRDVSAFEEAAQNLAARVPACSILEADHTTCQAGREVVYTVMLLEDLDQPGITLTHALAPPQIGRWYIAETLYVRTARARVR